MLIEISCDMGGAVVLTPDMMKSKVQNSPFGKVLSVGESVDSIAVGDMVYFQKWQKSEVSAFSEDGKLYALIKQEHVDAKYV